VNATDPGLRVSIIGLSGCGKSTCASVIEQIATERGLASTRLKLADPLYRLQAQVYATAGTQITPGAQDQRLMEALAEALRRIRPSSLVDDFAARLAAVSTPVVVNDDLRDPHVDAVLLRKRGFRVVRVTAPEDERQRRLRERGDPSVSDRSTAQLDLIPTDAVIHNDSDLGSYQRAVRALIGAWL
jgi:dephospho-CoA kinase